MKSLFAAVSVAALCAISAPAFAQGLSQSLQPVTYEGSVAYTGIDAKGADLGAVSLRARANFGQYVGLEAEGAFGVNDATGSDGGLSAKLHVNNEFAGYLVGRWPLTDKASLFARVGYGQTDIKASLSSGSSSAWGSFSQDSVNYGVGGEYLFDGKNGVRVDYTRFDFQNGALPDADTWSVGFVRRF
jgi:outer membrane immunogenic protein